MSPLQHFYLMLADAVLILHVAFVGFVVLGLIAIWVGWWRRWHFIRNFWFRALHLAAIGVVAAEAITGFICPLTTWEDRLRLLAGGEQRYPGSFIQHWLHRILFFDVDPSVFTMAYCGFFAAVALSLWLVPPRWSRGRKASERAPS